LYLFTVSVFFLHGKSYLASAAPKANGPRTKKVIKINLSRAAKENYRALQA
jgi:hypothetical protein